jgi:hypothetical protein
MAKTLEFQWKKVIPCARMSYAFQGNLGGVA